MYNIQLQEANRIRLVDQIKRNELLFTDLLIVETIVVNNGVVEKIKAAEECGTNVIQKTYEDAWSTRDFAAVRKQAIPVKLLYPPLSTCLNAVRDEPFKSPSGFWISIYFYDCKSKESIDS